MDNYNSMRLNEFIKKKHTKFLPISLKQFPQLTVNTLRRNN